METFKYTLDKLIDPEKYPVELISTCVFIGIAFVLDTSSKFGLFVLIGVTIVTMTLDIRSSWKEAPNIYDSSHDVLKTIPTLHYYSFIGVNMILWEFINNTFNYWPSIVLLFIVLLLYYWIISKFTSLFKSLSFGRIQNSFRYRDTIPSQIQTTFDNHDWMYTHVFNSNVPETEDIQFSQFYIPLEQQSDFSLLINVPPEKTTEELYYGGQRAFANNQDMDCCKCGINSMDNKETLFIQGVKRIRQVPYIVSLHRSKICENCINDAMMQMIQDDSVDLTSHEILSQTV